MALVTCNKLGQSLTAWLNGATEQERDALCAALECGGGAFDISDSMTITGTGKLGDPIRLEVKLSEAEGNILDVKGDGLYAGNASLDIVDGKLVYIDNLGEGHEVLNMADISISVEDGHTLTLYGDGSASAPLHGEVRLSPQPLNALAADIEGLMLPNTAIRFNPVTAVITFTDNKRQEHAVDLSQFLLDIHVNGASFNADTGVLTLTTNSAEQPFIAVDLSELDNGVTTGNTSSVVLHGLGKQDSPLTAAVRVSQDTNNLAEVRSDGLYVTASEFEGVTTGEGDGSVVLTGDGTEANPLTAAVAVPTITGQPHTSEGNELPTEVVGNRTQLLGQPTGWMEFPPNSGRKIPYWS